MQCANQFKQWGLAMINFEGVNKRLPYGAMHGSKADTWCTRKTKINYPEADIDRRRSTFVPWLWPFLEQKGLADIIDMTNLSIASVAQRQPIPLYTRPSDRPGYWEYNGGAKNRCRGNYILCWGYGDNEQNPYEGEKQYYRSAFSNNRQTKFSEIKDGLSNTVFMSEVLLPQDDSMGDFRGDFMNDNCGC